MINKEHYRYIREHPAFKNLPVEYFDKIAVEIQFRKVPKGQIIFFSGDKRERLFLIYKGYVRIEQYDQTDSFNYIDYVKENTMFPYGGMFEDKDYHYSGISVTDLEYFSIPVDLYEYYSKQIREQMLFITHKLSNILRFHELRLRNSVLASATERVIQAISILCIDFCQDRDDIPFALSMKELAKLGATTRETVNQVLKKLTEENIIQYNRKKLVFLNKEYFLKYFEDM